MATVYVTLGQVVTRDVFDDAQVRDRRLIGQQPARDWTNGND